jgi:hypothetical protein
MANRRDATTVLTVALLALLVGGVGLWLGFRPAQPVENGPPVAKVPDQGPIIYQMSSMFSEPDRIQLGWREIEGASAYRVLVMTATDDSLFSSDSLPTNVWTIPPALRTKLSPQTGYHWRLTVLFPDRPAAYSDIASFATQ